MHWVLSNIYHHLSEVFYYAQLAESINNCNTNIGLQNPRKADLYDITLPHRDNGWIDPK